MEYNNYHFKKLLNEPVKYTIKIIKDSVIYLSPIKKNNNKGNTQYTLNDYIIGMIDVCKNSTSWNNYTGYMNGNTLRKKFNEWVELGVFERSYRLILERYLKNQKTKELKYQAIDSTFIEDINGNKQTGYSPIYKRRKCESSKGIKITSIVTTKGIPISISIDTANKHDSPLLSKAINKRIIKCNTIKYRKHNRYKQYFLGDKGYDSKKNYELLRVKGYIPLIPQNKKNIKNKKLLRYFNTKQKTIYKKRVKIENYHSWLKKFVKIRCLYERKNEYYRGLLLLGVSIITSRRIINNS